MTEQNSNLLKLYDPNTPSKGNNLKLDRTGLFPQRGIFTEKEDRGIAKYVAEKYGSERLFTEDGVPYGYAYNIFSDGKLLAQKVKRFDKGMKWLYEGEKIPENLPLYGQHLYPAGGKFLTITEGEEDAEAAYQMLKEASPNFDPAVVSITGGAASAEKECKRNWEYINSFENIILAFDGDEPGKKAAEKVAKLFDFKPKIMLFPNAKKNKQTDAWEFKDSNDYLKAGKQKDFIRLWWSAEKFTPKGVLTFKSLWDAMTRKDENITVSYPWSGLNKMLHGMTTGHFVVVKAPPKVGKTSFLKELAYHIHSTSEHNVALIFLENTKKEIGMGLCALHMNRVIKPWDVPEDITELQKAHQHLSESERILIFDPEDDRTVDNIITKIMYFVKAHDCRFVLLDHITMLSYQSEDENERKFLDKLCADLKELTTSLDICLIAVTHVNDDGKTRGSRASVQLCESLLALHRDKTNPDPIISNTTEVIVEENRWGECGLASKLFYDVETGRMTELDPSLTVEVGGRSVTFDD